MQRRAVKGFLVKLTVRLSFKKLSPLRGGEVFQIFFGFVSSMRMSAPTVPFMGRQARPP